MMRSARDRRETRETAPQDAKVIARYVAVGTLTFLSAAHFGGGEGARSDAVLLRDGQGQVFIPGSSLAGVLRAFVRERWGLADAGLLFGTMLPSHDNPGTAADDEEHMSPLLVDDGVLLEGTGTAIRDHVRIDPYTGTAEQQGKFDEEVLEPGSRFRLRLELVVRQRHAQERERLIKLFNALLDGFSGKHLALGAHTQRGLGRCVVEDWRVAEYDFRDLGDVVAWLRDDDPPAEMPQRVGGIAPGEALASAPISALEITARLSVRSPLLVRMVPSMGDGSRADVVQYRSGGKPMVPGSSLAGVLRQRALRICHALGAANAEHIVDDIFGPRARNGAMPKQLWRSRLRVADAPITDAIADGEVQTRIAIDRFTGGVMTGALLQEAPTWPAQDGSTVLDLLLTLRPRHSAKEEQVPFEAECGLILLLLRDLCTEDLVVGGEQAVGRGRLRGEEGWARYVKCTDDGTVQKRRWQWRWQDGVLRVTGDDPGIWNGWVSMLQQALAAEEGGKASG